MTVIWYTRKHINEIIFKNRTCDMIEEFALVLSKSWAIMRGKYKHVLFSYFD